MNWWQRHDLDRAVVPVWAATLALAVCVPLFARGYVLTYDMVWVPQLDLDRPEIWGLGTGLPRAVPSDAVVALLDTVLPAALVQRLVLFAALSLLALGTARLLRERPLVAQLSGATLAVWNPFIAERLVLGQWPLLLALAAFPWLIGALGGKDGPRWAVAVIALAATALTPATGVMGVLIAVTAAWRRGVVTVVLLAALVNGPWIVAGLLRASISRTDPAAVKLFELQPEGHFGRLGSALTLGGVWNTEVVPTSRTLWIAVLIAVVIGAVIVVGLVMMWRDDRRLLAVLGMSGAIGLAIALLGWLAPELVTKVVADVPAGGLIRDGTRWLAMLVPLEAVAFGAGVHAVFHRFEFTAWELPVVVLAVMLPLTAILIWRGVWAAAWTRRRTPHRGAMPGASSRRPGLPATSSSYRSAPTADRRGTTTHQCSIRPAGTSTVQRSSTTSSSCRGAPLRARTRALAASAGSYRARRSPGGWPGRGSGWSWSRPTPSGLASHSGSSGALASSPSAAMTSGSSPSRGTSRTSG